MTISPDDEGRASPPSLEPLAQRTQSLQPLAPRQLARASMITAGDWIELDLDPATRHTSIGRAVRRAIVRSRGLAGDAVRLLALLDRTASRAVDAGAVFCASRIIEDADGDLMVATVLLQFAPWPTTMPPDLPPGIPQAPAGERCESVAQAIRNDAKWAGADVRVVPLSFVGPSVRLHVEDGGVIVQYLVALVDPTADIVLTFSCPCPPYARLMTAMFDDMAQSLQLHYE